MSERRRDTATVHTKTAQAKCIKRYKTQKDTANMHHQWKLTVNSQNRVAMTQPRYRTQTSYIFNSQSAATLSSGEELNISLLFAAHRNKDGGQWCNGNSPNSHEDRQETRHTARTAGSAHRGEPTDTSTPQRAFFWVTVQGGKLFFSLSKSEKIKHGEKLCHVLSITNPFALTRHQSNT